MKTTHCFDDFLVVIKGLRGYVFSGILKIWSKPMICLVIPESDSSCRFGACPSIFSSTKGHLGRYRTRDFYLMSGASLLRKSIRLSFRGRRIGGRSVDMEILF